MCKSTFWSLVYCIYFSAFLSWYTYLYAFVTIFCENHSILFFHAHGLFTYVVIRLHIYVFMSMSIRSSIFDVNPFNTTSLFIIPLKAISFLCFQKVQKQISPMKWVYSESKYQISEAAIQRCS